MDGDVKIAIFAPQNSNSMNEYNIEEIIAKYKELGSVWKVGEHFGMGGGKIHSILSKAGAIKKLNIFTEKDYDFLRDNYEYYRDRQSLTELAQIMGRTTAFLNRKAKELGLTNKPHKFIITEEKHRLKSEKAKERIRKYGHPKGFKGKIHNDDTKQLLAYQSRIRWQDPNYILNQDKYKKQVSDRMSELQNSGNLGVHSRCICGEVCIDGIYYVFKSSWEYDIALYLNLLKSKGYIDKWEYESEIFKFDYDGKGVRSYKPDFIIYKRSNKYYIEVKGWQDNKYKIKKDLMEKYYPSVNIIYIKEEQYKSISDKYSTVIPGWGDFKNIVKYEFKKCSIPGCQNKNHCKGLCRHHFYEKYRK